MRNLIGYLKKTPYLCSILIAFLFVQTPIFASDISVTTDFIHNLDGATVNTEVDIHMTAQTSTVLSYYTATISQNNISVECYNYDTNEKYECSMYNRGTATDILIDLHDSVITANNPLDIKLTYSTIGTLTNAYNINSYIEDTTTNSITIIYSKTKGEPLWTSDPIQNIKSIGDNYQIEIQKPGYHDLSLLFGESISYSFEISKTFVNSLDLNQTFELVVPSDSDTQTIVWKTIEPTPNTVEQDLDGNYIFKYILSSNSNTDCHIIGTILKHDTSENTQTLPEYLTQQTGNWELESQTELDRVNMYLTKKGLSIPAGFSSVTDLDDTSKELAYKYMYQYVIERLSPSTDLSSELGNTTRKGVTSLIENPTDSTSLDYTDLLIAIYRSYGIPARQVLGYISNISGYASDGFYHYWVEVYNSQSNRWITMDPFLDDFFGKSLYGSDFYDHISIITRGKSSVAPKLTFYDDNDFKITSTPEETIDPQLSFDSQLVFNDVKTTDSYMKGHINILNTGNIALTGYEILRSSIEDIEKYIDPVNNINSQIILPNQNSSIQLNIPYSEGYQNFFVDINFENKNNYSSEKLLETNISPKTPVSIQVLSKAISIALFSLIIYLIYVLGIKIFKKQNG